MRFSDNRDELRAIARFGKPGGVSRIRAYVYPRRCAAYFLNRTNEWPVREIDHDQDITPESEPLCRRLRPPLKLQSAHALIRCRRSLWTGGVIAYSPDA